MIDAQGRHSGLVTLEDIVEELLGDIQDEYDLLPIHVVRSGAGWLVGGGISLHRLKELTGIELEIEDTSSVGSNLNSWVTERLGHVPSGGDVVVQNGMRLLVRKVRRQRVLEALLA